MANKSGRATGGRHRAGRGLAPLEPPERPFLTPERTRGTPPLTPARNPLTPAPASPLRLPLAPLRSMQARAPSPPTREGVRTARPHPLSLIPSEVLKDISPSRLEVLRVFVYVRRPVDSTTYPCGNPVEILWKSPLTLFAPRSIVRPVMGGRGSGVPRGEIAGFDRGEPDAQLELDQQENGLQQALELISGTGGGEVRVYRRVTLQSGKTRLDRCGTYDVQAFDPESIADQYGPGEYTFQFYRREGVGGRIVRAATKVECFAAPARRDPPPTPPNTGGDLVQLMFQMQAQQLQRSHEMTVALIAALGGRGAAAPDSTSLLEAVKLGKEMSAATQPPAGSVVDSIKTGMELARLAGSGGEKPDLLAEMAPKLLELAGAALTAKPVHSGGNGAAGPVRASVQPVAPVPARPLTRNTPTLAQAGTPAGSGPAPQPAGDVAAGALKQWAPMILAEARAGRDARLWGTFIGERIPEFAHDAVIDLANLDDEARDAYVLGVAPELKPALPWLADAFEGILDALQPGDPGGDDGEDNIPGSDTPPDPKDDAAEPLHKTADSAR